MARKASQCGRKAEPEVLELAIVSTDGSSMSVTFHKASVTAVNS